MAKYDVEISAIACHGNALHPNKEIADKLIISIKEISWR